MRRSYGLALVAAAVVLAPCVRVAQAQDEQTRAVANGGIMKGWAGQIDAGEAKKGGMLSGDKVVMEGKAIHVTTGPAAGFWSTDAKASGDYTVSATFTEPKYMNLNDHPHPYGLFIGGNDMGTENQSYLYCAAYGNGNFIVRGFGPAAFQMNGRGAASEAVHKAAGKDASVTQQISMSVKGDKVSCSINGTEVASYPKSDIVSAGKLKSTDGVYGVRFSHNTDGLVTDLKVSK
jgi:hypothetical protein